MCIELPCGYSSQTLTKVIAYCEICIYIIGISVCLLFGTVLEARPDLLQEVANEKPAENQDILFILKLPHGLQTCFILWVCMNFITGLVFSIVLLHGAQERNLTKVRLWFVTTIIGYLLWLPILIFWAVHSVDPVNLIFSSLMSYIFGGLCLTVTYAFMEELRIESISHRPGFKNQCIDFNKI